MIPFHIRGNHLVPFLVRDEVFTSLDDRRLLAVVHGHGIAHQRGLHRGLYSGEGGGVGMLAESQHFIFPPHEVCLETRQKRKPTFDLLTEEGAAVLPRTPPPSLPSACGVG